MLRSTNVSVYTNYFLQVILSSRFIIIRSTDRARYLKNWEQALEIVVSILTRRDEHCIRSFRVEAGTLDYIKNLDELSEKYKNLKVEQDLKLGYNIDREKYGEANVKEQEFEHYNTKNIVTYMLEKDTCYYKEDDFSTAEYYGKDYIGRVESKIALFNDGKHIEEDNCISIVAEYRARLQQILIKSYTENYIKELI